MSGLDRESLNALERDPRKEHEVVVQGSMKPDKKYRDYQNIVVDFYKLKVDAHVIPVGSSVTFICKGRYTNIMLLSQEPWVKKVRILTGKIEIFD